MIAYNEDGRRIGEGHPHSTITDAVVKQIRDLHEDVENTGEKWGYRKLARRFNLPRDTIRKLCTYQRRAQVAREWRRVESE